jgi:hypothetical protein
MQRRAPGEDIGAALQITAQRGLGMAQRDGQREIIARQPPATQIERAAGADRMQPLIEIAALGATARR